MRPRQPRTLRQLVEKRMGIEDRLIKLTGQVPGKGPPVGINERDLLRVQRLRQQLAALDKSISPKGMALPEKMRKPQQD